MKKILAIIITASLLLSLSACGLIPGKTEPSQTPEASAEASPSPSASSTPSPSPSPSPTESAAAAFLASEPTAPELAAYMKENIQGVSKADADLLLERLVLLHLDLSASMNNKIWDVPYMTALNDTLGGVLDADKISDIQDDDVRADFQAVSDSMMTMERYEETPVFETDWAALEALKDAFSDNAAQLITYQNRFQGQYYYGDPYQSALLAEDITAVEQLITSMDNGFIRWQLKALYNRQVGRILYGAEGEWLYAFSDGDAEITENLSRIADKYINTEFGKLCAAMLNVQDEGLEAISAVIEDSMMLPPGDGRTLTKETLDENGAHLEFPVIGGLQDAAVTDQINAAISDFAKSLILQDKDNQSVGYYLSFVNDQYINFCFSYSYRNESDTDQYAEAYLLLDTQTGESITLDELADQPFDVYKDALLAAMGNNAPAELSPPVNFLLDRSELAVLVPSQTSDWPDYFPVTFNGLRSFMDISQLY